MYNGQCGGGGGGSGGEAVPIVLERWGEWCVVCIGAKGQDGIGSD